MLKIFGFAYFMAEEPNCKRTSIFQKITTTQHHSTKIKKYIAEGAGTMFLVLLACGSAVLAGPSIGGLGIGLCFGLVLVCLCYCLGNISGCHVNPAVSIAMFLAGTLSQPHATRNPSNNNTLLSKSKHDSASQQLCQPTIKAACLCDGHAAFICFIGNSRCYFTRSTYEPSRVSTRILSPILQNRGTRISAPVSSVAGLRVLVAVSPLIPGSV